MTSEPLPPPVLPDDAIRGLLERRVAQCGLSPGMVVGVTQGGKRSVVAHGAADTAGRALDGDAVFEIGSITKLFTALLLADMARRGEAALDEPVAALPPPGTRVPERHGKPHPPAARNVQHGHQPTVGTGGAVRVRTRRQRRACAGMGHGRADLANVVAPLNVGIRVPAYAGLWLAVEPAPTTLAHAGTAVVTALLLRQRGSHHA